MKDITKPLDALENLRQDACAGKLTEEQCRERLTQFKQEYGDDMLASIELGELKDEPASEEKLQMLMNVVELDGTSEETVVEMAKTGRALRNRKFMRLAAIFAAAACFISVIVVLLERFGQSHG